MEVSVKLNFWEVIDGDAYSARDNTPIKTYNYKSILDI